MIKIFNSNQQNQYNKSFNTIPIFDTLLLKQNRFSNLKEDLKNPALAFDYYNKNLDNNKPLFSDIKLLQVVLDNSQARNCLMSFFKKRAVSETLSLKQKNCLTIEEKNKLEGLKEIINAFSFAEKTYIPSNLSFCGQNQLSLEQRKKAHIAIHTASAACGALSGAMGEGAAVGADTPFLWGAQYSMFFALQKILGVSTIDHSMYVLRQYMMGQVLGVQGAKIILSWLGIAGHAASAGTASGPITGAIRSVNATLSTGITEKMGWGYVSEYKKDRMVFGKQALQTGIYLIGAELFGHLPNTVLSDVTNSNNIEVALNSIPKETLSTFGSIMKTLSDAHLDRLAFMFTANVAQNIFFAKRMPTNDELKTIISTSILNTAIYDLLGYAYEQTISNDAQETVKHIAEEFKKNPSVWKEFNDAQGKMFSEMNLDTLSSADFIEQFKDKKFVYNTAMISRELTCNIADKWRKRNFDKLKNEHNEVNQNIAKINSKTSVINNLLTEQEKKKIDLEMSEIVAKTKQQININSKTNFALNKIAGYQNVKTLLNLTYIKPIKAKEEEIPNTILFYGPSGLGKTMIGSAVAESIGAKFKSKNIGFENEDKLFEWIKFQMNNAQKTFKENGRVSIIQLNEFEDFMSNNTELRQKFNDLIKNSYKTHHCTFFLTTNNPLCISEDTLKNIEIRIPIDVPTLEDITQIIKYYIGNKKISDINYDEISEQIEKVKPKFSYSNAQIENIIKNRLPKECSQQNIIDIIKSIKPSIPQQNIDKFKNEQNILQKENL